MNEQDLTYSCDPDVETSSDTYALRFSGAVGEYILFKQRQALQSILDKHPAGSLRILDIGGGHAQLTETMLSYGHHVCVHGSSPECQQRLEKLSLLGEQVEFIVRPLSQLKADIGSFDMVTAFRLMAHVPDWRLFLAQLTSIAQKEVVIDFASTTSANIFSRIFFPFKLLIEKDTRTFNCQRLSEVGNVFDELGFKVISATKQFSVPLAIHRGLKNRKLSEYMENICEKLNITDLIGSPVIVSAERMRYQVSGK